MLIVRPLVMLACGTRIEGAEKLPKFGPAIIVANHNSHLDALVLMSLFPFSSIESIRPVAAFDYFFKNRLLRFISEKLIGILPIDRKRGYKTKGAYPLQPILDALDRGEIIIIFPEGSRGEPGKLKPFKSGFAHLTKMRPDVPVIPVTLSGTERSLPKDEALWVPFVIEIKIYSSYYYNGNVKSFTKSIERLFLADSRYSYAPAEQKS